MNRFYLSWLPRKLGRSLFGGYYKDRGEKRDKVARSESCGEGERLGLEKLIHETRPGGYGDLNLAA